MKIFWVLVFLALILNFCSGCAGWKPYADVAVGVPIESQTDYYLQTAREWQCGRGPQAHIEVGVESPRGGYIGLNHQSWWFCNTRNNRPEVYSNQWVFGWEFGGQ